MSDHQMLYEAMRRAAADSQNAAIRTRKKIGFASCGLALMLVVTIVLLNVGPHSVQTSVPAAQAASHPQAASVVPIAAVDPKIAVARKVPTAINSHRVASAKHTRSHPIDAEESADN